MKQRYWEGLKASFLNLRETEGGSDPALPDIGVPWLSQAYLRLKGNAKLKIDNMQIGLFVVLTLFLSVGYVHMDKSVMLCFEESVWSPCVYLLFTALRRKSVAGAKPSWSCWRERVGKQGCWNLGTQSKDGMEFHFERRAGGGSVTWKACPWRVWRGVKGTACPEILTAVNTVN